MKKKIAIIGANDFQNQLILKAKKMDYETHVFAWEDGAVGKENADFFYPISIIEKEIILEKCKEIKPDAVASIASDLASITVNYVGENLGLKGYNIEECVVCSTNKFKMRQAFERAGLRVPLFQRVTSVDEVDMSKVTFPVIVKPTDRSGSRSINKINSFDELQSAIKAAISDSFENEAMVEGYIDGQEFSCEAISYEGKHTILTITKKFTTEDSHFIEIGHIEPSGLSEEMQENVKLNVQQALTALGVQYGASHSEFKVNSRGDINFIEIGARMGGDCIGSDLVSISTGYDFVRMVIDVASGLRPEFTLINKPRIALIRFLMNKKDFETLDKIKEIFPSNIYRIYKDDSDENHEVKDSSTRLGYYIMAFEDRDTAEQVKSLIF